jgi:hypothetical protein
MEPYSRRQAHISPQPVYLSGIMLTIFYFQFIGVYVILSTRNFTPPASLVQPLLSGNRKLKAEIHMIVLLLFFSVQELVFNKITTLLNDKSVDPISEVFTVLLLELSFAKIYVK